MFRPSVAFSAIQLLEESGCLVDVPQKQTCCGQPAANSGDERAAREIAMQVIDAFDGYDYVVAPSGSCINSIRNEYPKLFLAETEWRARADGLSKKAYELTSFLVDVVGYKSVQTAIGECSATYHDSCSGLRNLNIREQPRTLLRSVTGLVLNEMTDANACCGFGGTFCVKYPDISNKIVSDKARNIAASKAEILIGGDLGCLLNMSGKLSRLGVPVKVYHVAEVLAGRLDNPAIGEKKGGV